MVSLTEHHTPPRPSTAGFLRKIGVEPIAPASSAFDPGYDPGTLEGHLQQSAHLISILKISMACWIVADENATRRKVRAARKYGVPTVTGGGAIRDCGRAKAASSLSRPCC
jgi:phosphosulfolactate synthase